VKHVLNDKTHPAVNLQVLYVHSFRIMTEVQFCVNSLKHGLVHLLYEPCYLNVSCFSLTWYMTHEAHASVNPTLVTLTAMGLGHHDQSICQHTVN
jgi:hypothetical protein